METKSVMPVTKRTAARNERGCDLSSKERVYGLDVLAVPIINTRV
jgi:hypothetical protein